jgi:hypothetical protein
MIESPVPGVVHSLQKDDAPFDAKTSLSGEPLVFDFPVRLTEGSRLLGDFVQREGAERRFVYVRIGASAGDHGCEWNRRMKIDIHDIPAALLQEGLQGKRLQATIHGTAKDGSPACATVRVLRWSVT